MQVEVFIDWENAMTNKDTVVAKGFIRETNKRIDHIYYEGHHVIIRLDRIE